MWMVWAIAIVAWSIVPYKSWSRELFASEGFNLGDVVLLLGLAPCAFSVIKKVREDKLWLAIALLWATTIISLGKGIVLGEDLREMLRVARALMLWAVVPLMVSKIRTVDVMRRCELGLAVLLAIASLSIVVFSYYPSLIPANDEVAYIREEWYEGIERIFTSGMWGVFTGTVLVVSALFVAARHKTGTFILTMILLVGLLHTFVRTYLVLLAIALAMLLWRRWRASLRTLSIPLGIMILLVIVFGLPDSLVNLVQGTSTRMSGMFQADLSELDATDANAFGTVIWRVLEVEGALSNIKTPIDWVFGVMGRPYTLGTTDVATVPHIGLFSILYVNGVLGVVAYGVSLTIITRRLQMNRRDLRGTPLSWATQGAFAAWVCLLLGCFMAPLLHVTYGVECFALVIGFSEVVHRLSCRESAHANEPSQNNSSDPKLQLGAIH
jgi:hypothetical protein